MDGSVLYDYQIPHLLLGWIEGLEVELVCVLYWYMLSDSHPELDLGLAQKGPMFTSLMKTKSGHSNTYALF
jgi:hypothetical protein